MASLYAWMRLRIWMCTSTRVRSAPRAQRVGLHKIAATQGIIRLWAFGDDIYLSFGNSQICCFHGSLDHPAVCRGRARDVQRRSAFGNRLAEIARSLGAPLKFAPGRGFLRVLAPLCCWRFGSPRSAFGGMASRQRTPRVVALAW